MNSVMTFPRSLIAPGEADLCWERWQRSPIVLSVDSITLYLSLFNSIVSREASTCDIVKKKKKKRKRKKEIFSQGNYEAKHPFLYKCLLFPLMETVERIKKNRPGWEGSFCIKP